MTMTVRAQLDDAAALLREQRWAEADAAFTAVIESGTSDDAIGEAYRGRSGCRLMAGDLSAAVADAVAHVDLRSDDPRAYVWLASLLVMGQEWPGAIEAYRHAFALGWDDAVAWCASGEARMKLGDVEGALEDLARAVSAHPGFVPARLARAVLNASTGHLEAAIEDWQAAIALDPTQALTVDGYIDEARSRIAAVAVHGPHLALKIVCCGAAANGWVRRVAQHSRGVVSHHGRMEVATVRLGGRDDCPVLARFHAVEGDPGELADDADGLLQIADVAPADAATFARRIAVERDLEESVRGPIRERE